jgi:hypothetical protein
MEFQINLEDLKNLIADSKNERAGLSEVINPILDKYKLEKKEVLELCQIGKFVYKIDSEIRIIDKPKPPSPDFIMRFNDKLIGLEHTQILTEQAGQYLKIKTLIDYAKQTYESKYPDTNVHATISIKNDKLDYKQNEKAALAEQIAESVQLTRLSSNFELPDFITQIRTAKHSKVSFTYRESNWQSGYLTRERLKQEITKKESKISGYRNSEFELVEFWLVLLIGSLSSVSYELNEMENYEMDSEFDRVYLMADFDAKIIRVK